MATEQGPRVDADAVEELAQGLRGEIIADDDEEYDDVREIWNGYIDTQPALLIRCQGAADVMKGMEFANNHDLPYSVRGGGHNQTGASLIEDGIVLDLQEMTSVRVDPDKQVAQAEPGCRACDILKEAQQFGLATPTGSAGDVGLPGSTLSGAIGWIRRKHGLGIDKLRSVDIVTPEGELVHANEDQNEDLFWAVRGGGGNFGVVTNFEFELVEVGPVVGGLGVFYPGEEAEEILEKYHELTQEAPDELSTMCLVADVPNLPPMPDNLVGQDAVAIMGCYAGDVEEGMEAIQPFREISEPLLDMSEPMPYMQLHALGSMMYPDGRKYSHRSVYVDNLNEDYLDQVIESADAAPSPMGAVGIWHMGGAISDVDSDETAYPHRKKQYMITFEANWEGDNDDANIEWCRESDDAFRALGGEGTYGGFTGVDPRATEDLPARVYGDNFSRLMDVKKQYDPSNDLHKNVNIDPTDN